MATVHPEVVSRLTAVLDETEAKDDTRQERFIIGSDKHNPVEFNPSSWSDRVLVWQTGIRKRCIPRVVPIFAEAEVPGIYRFRLRRWPEEVNQPIRGSAELTVPDGFEGKTKTEKGKALPIIKARLKAADFDKTIDVTDEMIEATFTVPLKKGACDINAQFIADDGKEYGAFFFNVTRE